MRANGETLRGEPGEAPRVVKMPADAREYAGRFSVVNFINAYYQVRDCLAYQPKTVLVVGLGVGLEPVLFRERFGLAVTTLDIDPEFGPDEVGSVHDLSRFGDQQFDVLLASHVLEHLPFSLFGTCLSEIARVAAHAVIYLPLAGRHLGLKLTHRQRQQEWDWLTTVPPFRRISGEVMELQAGQHYWEIGYRGFSKGRIAGFLEACFLIDEAYQNREWHYSMNYRLTSRLAAPTRLTAGA